ncbi:glycosyltransferase [Roseivirga sp. BDSF3-8]|uniref:glycosyltransferase n=1 Tax=Roseivirga sp. BDSF3-8 TaxID=3241598 RepID=UPI0035318006
MSKKKLAILIISLRGGGAERVASILLQELHEVYDVHLVLMSRDIVYDIPDNIRIHYLTDQPADESTLSRMMNLPRLAWAYHKLARREGFDVSLSFMYRPNFINVLARKLGMKARVLISERNNPSEQHPLFRFLVRRLYGDADVVVPNAAGMGRELINNFGVPEAKVAVIHNPVDFSLIRGEGDIPANANAGTEGPFRFVTLGRLNRTKNQVMLVEAMHVLEDKDCVLDIIGEGDQRPVIEDAIKKYGLEKRVNLLGFRKNPHQYMADANSFVYGSNFEGFPNVLIEAMALGLPVISTDCRFGPREILHPTDTDYSRSVSAPLRAEYGYLQPLNDAKAMADTMRLIMENSDLREQMSKKSLERAGEYEKDKIITRFRQIIG